MLFRILGFFGWFFVAVFVGVVVIVALILCFGIGLDSVFSLNSKRATLDCFHCGLETPAHKKTCDHCGKELQ